MIWRRVGGAILMGLGGLVVLAMCAVAAVVIANYVEWENAADALGTVAMIASVPIGGGILVALLGRFVYGDWTGRAPMLGVSSLALRFIGGAIAAVLAGMLVLLMTMGVGPEDRGVAVSLCIGVMIGVGIGALGFLLRPRAEG